MRYVLSVIVLCAMGGPAVAQGPWPWLDPADDRGTVTVLMMGDTNIQHRTDPSQAYAPIRATLAAADIRFVNLEGPFAGASTDPLVPDIPHKSWTHSEPDQVDTLVAGGIDAVGVANNVTYPWQALMRSLDVLDRAGVAHVGGGKDIQAAHRPLVLERRGVKVGFLSYAATVFPFNHAATRGRPGIAQIKVYTAYQPPRQLDKPGQPPNVITWLDEVSRERMVDDVRRLKARTDVVIVSYHWGVSNTTRPVSFQGEVGRAVIDAGADLVLGHGPHKYQPVEVYKGRPILYSVGQGLFDDPLRSRKHREGLLVRAVIRDKRLVGVSLVPTWRDDEPGLDMRLYDPNEGKGRELFGYLLSVHEDGAVPLAIEGREIVVRGVGPAA